MCGYAGQVCDHLTSSCGDFVDRFSINIKHQQPPPPPSSTTANDDDDGCHNSPDTNEGKDETMREWQREGRGWATRRVAQPLLLCFFVRVLIYFRFLLYEQVFYRLAATNIDEGITTTNGTNTTPSLAPKASGGVLCFVLADTSRHHPLPQCERRVRLPVLVDNHGHQPLPRSKSEWRGFSCSPGG